MTVTLPDLVEGVFKQGEVHLIGGSRGAGKTAFECWLAKHVLKGDDFLGHKTNPPAWWGALVLDRDMDQRLVWWSRCGVGKLPYFSLFEDPLFSPNAMIEASAKTGSDPGWMFRLLERALQTLKPPQGGVLTIDVCNPFAGHHAQAYLMGLAYGQALRVLAKSYGITVLGLMHGGKIKSRDTYIRLTDRIIASSGFLGACDTVCYLTTLEESQVKHCQEFVWEPHLAPAEHFILKRTSDGLFQIVDSDIAVELGQAETKALAMAPEDRPETWKDRWGTYLPWIPPEGGGVSISTEEVIRRAFALPVRISQRTAERDLFDMEKAGLISRYQGLRGRWQRKEEEGS